MIPPALALAGFNGLWHPLLALSVLLLGAASVAAARLEGRTRGAATPVAAARQAAFLAALAALYAALGSPLDLLSDYLFSAHMLEHALLTLAVAPLLVLARPVWLLPPRLRELLAGRLPGRLARPPLGLLLFNATYAAYHLPLFYQAGLDDGPVHVLEHAALVACSLLMWWPVCGPAGARLAPLPRLRYLLAAGLAMLPLCGALAFAGHGLYPAYANSPLLWGLSPLHDQELGALVMILAATVAYDLAALAAFLQLSDGEAGALPEAA